MMHPTILTSNQISNNAIGGKAKNLQVLDQLGFSVPKWTVLPYSTLLHLEHSNLEHFLAVELLETFGADFQQKSYAVRSSAIGEDGQKNSFAGLFETQLHVPFDGLSAAVKAVWESADSERIRAYRKEKGLSNSIKMNVIVQEMIDSDVSGVAFGKNPVNSKEEIVINAVFGLGEGLVSGTLNADTYSVFEGKTTSIIAQQAYIFQKNESDSGVVKEPIKPDLANQPCLNDEQIQAITAILKQLKSHFGAAQDIEFTYQDGQLFLLQTRPITTQNKEYILWDNSNIIESYPGVTTPLTFSFISKIYDQAYRQFVQLLGVSTTTIEENKTVFANTLGLVRGRVYYNLRNWYKMLAMLPGYSINAPFMENMMGVKEQFDLKEDLTMGKATAWLRIFWMLVKMIYLQINLPFSRKRFFKHVEQTLQKYKPKNFFSTTSEQLIQQYEQLEQELLLEWKAPLVNDFFAMIWFGLLQKLVQKHQANTPNLHNDLLCGSQDIISVQPIRKLMYLVQLIKKDNTALQLFQNKTANEVYTELENNAFPIIKNKINDYITQFGDRCVGELKLETIAYAQEPQRFIKIIQSYIKNDITVSENNDLEQTIRLAAESKMRAALQGKFLQKIRFKLVLQMTRDLVSNRENLRYERTRAFGIARRLFNAIGAKMVAEQKIIDARDIYYLELNEIKKIGTGSFEKSIVQKIAARKAEFKAYSTQKPPVERFSTYGFHFPDHQIYSNKKLEISKTDLKGIGCCPGLVEATIRVVLHPEEVETMNGDILVTTSTDPGWITLFPSAAGIIVERGSLLSHSAIVSREMGIPCIVSVDGLLHQLKTGDRVLMNGSTGEIQKISNKQTNKQTNNKSDILK